MKITPYEVEGKVDYEKLVREFGVSKLTLSLIRKVKKPPLLMRRGFFYAHRDFDKILGEKEFAIVSGRGPSGPLTLGHLAVFKAVKEFQDAYGCRVFIPLSDDEKFLYREIKFEDAQKFAKENLLDLIALGFNLKKTEFMIDTINLRQEVYNLAVKCAKRMTLSTVKDSLGFKDSQNIGSVFYPAMQAAHILYPTARYGLPVLVVIAIDQDVLIRLARDVAPKIGLRKPADLLSKFLPSLGPEDKMSASQPDLAIYVSDPPEEVRRKIRKAYTGGRDTPEQQARLGGKPEVCKIFDLYRFGLIEDDRELENTRQKCKQGKLLCKDCKAFAVEKVLKFLKEHQKKREKAKKVAERILNKELFGT